MSSQPTPDLNAEIFPSIVSQLQLLLGLTDGALYIASVSPEFAKYFGHPMAGQYISKAIPELGGVEEELARIAAGKSASWHILSAVPASCSSPALRRPVPPPS